MGGFFLSGWRQELGWDVSWSYLMVEVQREGKKILLSGFQGFEGGPGRSWWSQRRARWSSR